MVRNVFNLDASLGRARKKRSFLHYYRLGLCFAALCCLAMLALLWSQGESAEALSWMLAAGLICLGPLEMAKADKVRLAKTRTAHFSLWGANTFFAVFIASGLMQTHAWLVCSCLIVCLLLTSYLEQQLLYAIGDEPSSKFVLKIVPASAVYAVVGLASIALTATAYAFIVPFFFGAIVGVHGVLLWFNLRLNDLSEGQHVDVWPRYLRSAEASLSVWVHLQCYLVANNDGLVTPMQKVVAKIDEDTLLAYFQTSPMDYGTLRPLTQAIQQRICALNPHAAAVFEMHDDNAEAANMLITMRAHGPERIDVLELPDMDSSHA